MLQLPVSDRGVRLPRWLVLVISGVLVIALCFSTEVPSSAEPSDPPTPSRSVPADPEVPASGEPSVGGLDSDGDGTADRPDLVSAAITAQALDEPVEDLSGRDETNRVVVNPDGSVTEELYGAPMWVQDAEGTWVDVDYTLVPRPEGGFVPKAASTDLVIDGGTREFARLVLPDGSATVWSWPQVLPVPTVDGPVATYAVAAGVDLLVIATARGVSTRIQVNNPQAVVPAFKVQVRMIGADLDENSSGNLVVTGDDEKEASADTGTLLAWDSRLDEFGDPVKVVAVDASLRETGSSGERTDHELTLRMPDELVNDPDVVYPIIIDPDLSPFGPQDDTWVREGMTWISELEYRLIVGASKDHTNNKPAVSYLRWDNGRLRNRTISKAEVGFFQYMSASCSTKRADVHPLTSTWSGSGTKWTNKPSVGTSLGKSTYFTKNIGASGCTPAGGWVTADVTKMAQMWADGADAANYGLQLSVPDGNKNDVSFERRLCSVNYDTTHTTCKSASKTPYLKFTYTNRKPSAPAKPAITSSKVEFNGRSWATSGSPTFSTKSAVGVWGSTIKMTYEVRTSSSATAVSKTCTSGSVDWWLAGACAVSGLTAGGTYAVRAKATDSNGLVSDWSAWLDFGITQPAPATPTISCGYADKEWRDTRIAATTTCTFTSARSKEFVWSLYTAGKPGLEPQAKLTANASGQASTTISIPAAGYVQLTVLANGAGYASGQSTYSFGIGSPSVTLPRVDDRSTSTFPLKLGAAANQLTTATPTARVEWRYPPASASDTSTGWTQASKVKVKDTGQNWAGAVTKVGGSLETPLLAWAAADEPGIQIPSLLEVRFVFSYPGDAKPQISKIHKFQLVPHAFGGAYPTQDVGPGTLALFTGEYQLSQTDVTVPGNGGELTVGRVHGTLTGDPAGPAGVFGPGWSADFAGQGAGLAGYTVTDHTGQDGTFVLTSPDAESNIYAHVSGTRGALNTASNGAYVGVGETALLEDKLRLAAVTNVSGVGHSLVLTEKDGTITEFHRRTNGAWFVARTTEPEDNSTVTFIRNAEGLLSWVLAPAPGGVTCTETVQQPGCRALTFTYGTFTVNGSSVKRLTAVRYVAWDPKPGADGKPGANAGMATVDVARYGYDSSGRLVEYWEPQFGGDDGTGHKMLYGYTTINGKTVVNTITEPGRKPWRFEYQQTALAKVKRALDPATGSGDATWTVAYDVRLTGAGLPDLMATTTQTWGMTPSDVPVSSTAVFEPDHVPAATPTAADWPFATISYFTAGGRSTNTAVFGAGEWLIDSTRYDANGNVIWTLSAAGRKAALAESNSVAASDRYATWTVYNSAGTRVEATYSPMRQVTLENGSVVLGRTVTETDYDDETTDAPKTGRPADAPDGGYMLAVETRTAVTGKTNPAASGSTWDVKKIRYRYDPVVSGDKSGWDLRVPTRTLTQDGSGWATTITRYDNEGRVVETRSPGGAAISNTLANDPYTIRTTYYTSDASASVAACRNTPGWAGNACRVAAAGNPSSGHPIPATATTGYSLFGSVTRVEETAGSATRATITVRDYLDRETASTTTLTGHDPIGGTTTYDQVTGDVTASTGNGVTENYTYDTWGRALTVTDGTGNTATTTYDSAGRVAAFNDGKGVSSYTYDGTDALGRAERRGLVTKVDLGYATDTSDQFTGAYDVTGGLVKQKLGSAYTMEWTRNIAGQATALTYTDSSDAGAVPLSFTQAYDHLGRVRTATSLAGSKTYRYDDRARLVMVEETDTDSRCTTRQYAFTGDSNRTSRTTWAPTGNGACQHTSGGTVTSYSYDQADRITGAGYSYDPMGRTLTMPAAHTSQAGVDGASGLTIGYHANDMVASLTQTVPDPTGEELAKRQAFTLDASDRISAITTSVAGTVLTETLNHYDGESDNPAWTETRKRTDGDSAWETTWHRYLSDLTGGLAIDLDDTGAVVLQIANLHGDVVATTTLGQAGITSYTEADEYGNLPAGTTPSRYGWLGTHQRDADTLGGLVLMGARLYAPAAGRFLSIDPVEGGNDNRYTYPADPINELDLTGEVAFVIPLVIIAVVGAAAMASTQTPHSRTAGANLVTTTERKIREAKLGLSTLAGHAKRGASVLTGVAMAGIAYSVKNTKAVKKKVRAEQKAASKEAKQKKKKSADLGNPHRKNARQSSKEKHQAGKERRIRDKGGEVGDKRRQYRRR